MVHEWDPILVQNFRMTLKMSMKSSLLILALLIHNGVAVSNFMSVYTKFEISRENYEFPNLLHYIVSNYMMDCSLFILYDEFFYETHIHKDTLFKSFNLLKEFPTTNGFIDKFNISFLYKDEGRRFCFHFIIFSNDEELAIAKLGFQLSSKVVVVSTFSRFQLAEFLASQTARNIMNLLVITDPLLTKDDYQSKKFKDISLFTHKLHADGIGSSSLQVLTAWRKNKLTRSSINLFPPKLDRGFNGHQFLVAAYDQPPFVYRNRVSGRGTEREYDIWDGNEVRLLKLVAQTLNFGVNIMRVQNANETNGADKVLTAVRTGAADFGISGLYVTRRAYGEVYFSLSHVQDCAVFITLSSTAIPKYRAILGPFQWGVWLCIIGIYLAAVVPLAYSEKRSWKKLYKSWGEVCHMFWVVFGTFTNLFTYKGEDSWNKSRKNGTCVAIGTYWVFTIIITAAYSSSIISFITIPTYFDVVDNINDLMDEEFRIGVADSRDWKVWFNDTGDYATNKLLKNLDVVNSTDLGVLKVQKNERYAFLGSQHHLSHIVRTNFSGSSKKKSKFHIASQCVASFMVSVAMKKNSDFSMKIDQQIQRLQENGLVEKIRKDLEWEIARTSKGSLFSFGTNIIRSDSIEDRQLTVDDMQGMFLLLGIGVSFAAASLLRECALGYQCFEKIKARSQRPSIPSIRLTPCEDSLFQGSLYVQQLSDACRRTVSASISFGEFALSKMNSRRNSH
ncbi:ionotropic receptor 21a [Planococcus citri]|uniref:ionotropic receptor 21a n=1 Tax=Planococcus citri TaxID=170843 RepID=UPI0031F9ECD8